MDGFQLTSTVQLTHKVQTRVVQGSICICKFWFLTVQTVGGPNPYIVEGSTVLVPYLYASQAPLFNV